MFIMGYGALLVSHGDLRQNQRFVEGFLELIDHNRLLCDIGNLLITPGVGQKPDSVSHASDVKTVVIGRKGDDPLFKRGFWQQIPFIIGKRQQIEFQLIGGLAVLFVRFTDQPLKFLGIHRGGQSVIPGIGAAPAKDHIFSKGDPLGGHNGPNTVNQIF